MFGLIKKKTVYRAISDRIVEIERLKHLSGVERAEFAKSNMIGLTKDLELTKPKSNLLKNIWRDYKGAIMFILIMTALIVGGFLSLRNLKYSQSPASCTHGKTKYELELTRVDSKTILYNVEVESCSKLDITTSRGSYSLVKHCCYVGHNRLKNGIIDYKILSKEDVK